MKRAGRKRTEKRRVGKTVWNSRGKREPEKQNLDIRDRKRFKQGRREEKGEHR